MRLFVLACLVFLTLADSTSGSGTSIDVEACTKECLKQYSKCTQDAGQSKNAFEKCKNSFCALRCIFHGASDNDLQCFVDCRKDAETHPEYATKVQACPATCGLSGGGTSGGTSGGGTSGGSGDRDVCITGCTGEMKTCEAAAKLDTSALKKCYFKFEFCAVKCSIPGFPDSALECVAANNIKTQDCYKNIKDDTPENTKPCQTQGEVGASKCLNPSLPGCLQDLSDSRAFNCFKKNGGITDRPKNCAGVNIVIKCMQTECNGIPKIFDDIYRLDELKKKLCPTLSPTVVGGTLSPTTSDYVGVVPTSKPLLEPSAGSTVPCVLQLVSVLIVCLML